MKLTKIMSLILVAIFILGTMSSCVTDAAEISVNLIIKAGDDRIFNSTVKFAVTSEDGTATVINIVNEAIAMYELDIELETSGSSIKRVKNYKETQIDDTLYYWFYTINGVEPTSGKADTNTVKDGDIIEYVFSYSKPDPNVKDKSITGPYDSAWELFGEAGEAVTEEPAETEAP